MNEIMGVSVYAPIWFEHLSGFNYAKDVSA